MMSAPLSLLVLVASLSMAMPRAVAQQPAAASAPQPSSLIPADRTDKGGKERCETLLQRAQKSEPTKVLFVGDSITQSWEGPGRDAWQEHIAPLGALNLGNSGDRTEHVLWRLQQAPLTRLEPKHVVLMIGTNNLGHHTSNAAETLAGVQAVVKVLLEQCPKATVHVLEIFPRSAQFDPMRVVDQAVEDAGGNCRIADLLMKLAHPNQAGPANSRTYHHAPGLPHPLPAWLRCGTGPGGPSP